MRRKACVMLVLVALGGCASFESGPESSGGGYGGGAPGGCGHGGCTHGAGGAPPAVPGVQGPWGQNVAMASPYSSAPPGAMAAQAMMQQSMPLDMVQMTGGLPPGMGGGLMQAGCAPPGANPPQIMTPAGGMLSPPGVPFAPGMPNKSMLPPNTPPGGDPYAGGIMQASYPAGAVAAIGALADQVRFPVQRTQVRFVRPSGMKISWYTQGADGKPSYSTSPIETPGRYNFLQAAIYRLKLSNIEGRPGLEIYPTLEVVPVNSKTEPFLAHSSVPLEFTNEDFKQISEGNYVVKVIYLPDPQYQELAGTGTEEILSTRLEPGADPIKEALRRGSILLVVRMGNMDQEAPNTPPINAPSPNAPAPMMQPGMGPGMPGPGPMVPYFGMRPMGPNGPMAGPPGAMMGPMGPMGPNGPMAGPGGPMGPGPMAGPSSPMMPPGPGPGFGPMVGPNGPMMPPRTGPLGPVPPNGAFTNSAGPLTGPSGPALGPNPTPAPNGPFLPPSGPSSPPNGFPSNGAGPIGPPPGIRSVPPPSIPGGPSGFNAAPPPVPASSLPGGSLPTSLPGSGPIGASEPSPRLPDSIPSTSSSLPPPSPNLAAGPPR